MKATPVAFSLILLASTPAFGEPGQARAPHAAPRGSSDGERKVDATFAAEVLVLHATNTQKGIDARIGAMPELKKPPFSSYDSYELLDRARLTLDRQSPKTLKLANGRVLETRLVEVLGKELVRLSASINQPGGKEFLPLLEVKAKVGQAFIVAGQRYKQGILVLVLRVTH
ncbi:MAG TPA: hypothetical protein VFQ35_12230 [Polyangiaceae bacterium]|nr:hypothetical protein [Polyangiaceae bacterium]